MGQHDLVGRGVAHIIRRQSLNGARPALTGLEHTALLQQPEPLIGPGVMPKRFDSAGEALILLALLASEIDPAKAGVEGAEHRASLMGVQLVGIGEGDQFCAAGRHPFEKPVGALRADEGCVIQQDHRAGVEIVLPLFEGRECHGAHHTLAAQIVHAPARGRDRDHLIALPVMQIGQRACQIGLARARSPADDGKPLAQGRGAQRRRLFLPEPALCHHPCDKPGVQRLRARPEGQSDRAVHDAEFQLELAAGRVNPPGPFGEGQQVGTRHRLAEETRVPVGIPRHRHQPPGHLLCPEGRAFGHDVVDHQMRGLRIAARVRTLIRVRALPGVFTCLRPGRPQQARDAAQHARQMGIVLKTGPQSGARDGASVGGGVTARVGASVTASIGARGVGGGLLRGLLRGLRGRNLSGKRAGAAAQGQRLQRLLPFDPAPGNKKLTAFDMARHRHIERMAIHQPMRQGHRVIHGHALTYVDRGGIAMIQHRARRTLQQHAPPAIQHDFEGRIGGMGQAHKRAEAGACDPLRPVGLCKPHPVALGKDPATDLDTPLLFIHIAISDGLGADGRIQRRHIRPRIGKRNPRSAGHIPFEIPLRQPRDGRLDAIIELHGPVFGISPHRLRAAPRGKHLRAAAMRRTGLPPHPVDHHRTRLRLDGQPGIPGGDRLQLRGIADRNELAPHLRHLRLHPRPDIGADHGRFIHDKDEALAGGAPAPRPPRLPGRKACHGHLRNTRPELLCGPPAKRPAADIEPARAPAGGNLSEHRGLARSRNTAHQHQPARIKHRLPCRPLCPRDLRGERGHRVCPGRSPCVAAGGHLPGLRHKGLFRGNLRAGGKELMALRSPGLQRHERIAHLFQKRGRICAGQALCKGRFEVGARKHRALGGHQRQDMFGMRQQIGRVFIGACGEERRTARTGLLQPDDLVGGHGLCHEAAHIPGTDPRRHGPVHVRQAEPHPAGRQHRQDAGGIRNEIGLTGLCRRPGHRRPRAARPARMAAQACNRLGGGVARKRGVQHMPGDALHIPRAAQDVREHLAAPRVVPGGQDNPEAPGLQPRSGHKLRPVPGGARQNMHAGLALTLCLMDRPGEGHPAAELRVIAPDNHMALPAVRRACQLKAHLMFIRLHHHPVRATRQARGRVPRAQAHRIAQPKRRPRHISCHISCHGPCHISRRVSDFWVRGCGAGLVRVFYVTVGRVWGLRPTAPRHDRPVDLGGLRPGGRHDEFLRAAVRQIALHEPGHGLCEIGRGLKMARLKKQQTRRPGAEFGIEGRADRLRSLSMRHGQGHCIKPGGEIIKEAACRNPAHLRRIPGRHQLRARHFHDLEEIAGLLHPRQSGFIQHDHRLRIEPHLPALEIAQEPGDGPDRFIAVSAQRLCGVLRRCQMMHGKPGRRMGLPDGRQSTCLARACRPCDQPQLPGTRRMQGRRKQAVLQPRRPESLPHPGLGK